jgi:hypothetical protein
MKDGNELYNQLREYTGCDQPYRHPMYRRFFYTDGMRHFLLNAGNGALWLVDILATEPKIKNLLAQEGFAAVRLKVTGAKAVLTVDDGNGNVHFTRNIDLTDCPQAPVTKSNPDGLWLFYIEPTQIGSEVGTMMMLPGER